MSGKYIDPLISIGRSVLETDTADDPSQSFPLYRFVTAKGSFMVTVDHIKCKKRKSGDSAISDGK